MSIPTQIPPMLEGCLLGDAISDHHGVRCYPALRQETGDRYILKIITVPANASQLEALLLSGACASPEQAMDYFKDLAAGIVQEAQLLQLLGNAESFEPYLYIQSLPREDGTGYDIQLVSRYLPSLATVMPADPLTHLAAINLGLDLCAALTAARRAGYLYVDLKPDNLYLTESGSYRIGDLGFIPLSSVQYASLPEKYRSRYTAPEIGDAMSSLTGTMDIYALGLILYQLYNNCALPEQVQDDGLFPTPLYADYELAHIITKACAADPAQRWQDPAQMGQALVDYMQRNGVNNTPIIPEPVVFEEPQEEIEAFLSEEENDEEFAQILAAIGEEEPPRQLVMEGGDFQEEELSSPDSAEIAQDETESTGDSDDQEQMSFLDETESPDEFSQVMALADDLMTHQPPEPVVVPEPIDVAVPPLPEEPEPEPEIMDEDEEEDTDDTAALALPVKRPPVKLVAWLSAALLLLCSICAGIIWYQEFYLLPVQHLTVSGSAESLQVEILSDIDDKLLTVVCTDTYGNTLHAPVKGGIARFDQLNPSTHYYIRVEVSGLHKLTGHITDSFTTAKQTNILNFTAVCGPESGSAILNFSVTGPDTDRWTVIITAPGEDERTQSFSGHTVTVFGLTPGTTYTFCLDGGAEIPMGSGNELSYTAQSILKAQQLEVTDCGNGSMTLRWQAPDAPAGQRWTLRCYNDQGYDKTVVTDTMEYTFTELDHSTGYTVMITAEGMTESASVSVSANPIRVNGYTVTPLSGYALELVWDYTGEAPASGWIVTCRMNGAEEFTVPSGTNSILLAPVSGCTYEFTARPADDTTCFTQSGSYTAGETASFAGFGITAANLTASTVLRPQGDQWSFTSLNAGSYKSDFSAGETAALLLRVNTNFTLAADEVSIVFSIRDAAGRLHSIDHKSAAWSSMWSGIYCPLNLPVMPREPGSYILDLYFNEQIVASLAFTVA